MNFVDILAIGTLTGRVSPTLVFGSVTYESMIMLKSMHRWHLAPNKGLIMYCVVLRLNIDLELFI